MANYSIFSHLIQIRDHIAEKAPVVINAIRSPANDTVAATQLTYAPPLTSPYVPNFNFSNFYSPFNNILPTNFAYPATVYPNYF